MSTVESTPYTPFAISTVRDRDEVAVVIVGELDLASVEELERAVAELIQAESGRIVVDLRGIDFIDSTGLSVLISLRNDAKRNGRALTLVPPASAARRIFQITGTRGLFDWRERPRT